MTKEQQEQQDKLRAMLTGTPPDPVDSDEVSMPALRLAQPGQAICTPDQDGYVEGVKPGHFYDALTRESFGNSVRFCILRFFGSNFIEFDPRNRKVILDGCVPKGDERTIGHEEVDKDTGEVKWVKAPATRFMDYALLLADNPERGPILWSASGKTEREARAMNGIARAPIIDEELGTIDAPAPYARVFVMRSGKQPPGQDGKIRYATTIMPDGFTHRECVGTLETAHNSMAAVKQIQDDRERSLKRLPEATGSDPADSEEG